ncbi:MAG: hypothetical protein ABIF77_09075 [bacterium]
MISPGAIWTIARVEGRTLLRSWFFRIMSLVALTYFGFFDYFAVFSKSAGDWELHGIPSTIPYVNILFLNAVQAVVAVFLASDFLKRDKKLDTTEVIYMRSLTNTDYVWGKTLGILLVFGGLNLVVLAMPLVINLFFPDIPIVWKAYLYYPLLISLPTLVFILGLSFLFMVLIRNQAVTFIVLLGYVATTMFFLGRKFNYLFDYMAFNVPLMYSGFTGFGDVTSMLIHRGMYFLLGLGCIFLTIFLLQRLPQSRLMHGGALVMAILCLTGGLGLGFRFVQNVNDGKALRVRLAALGDDYFDTPTVTPLRYGIELEHREKSFAAAATMVVRNENAVPLDRYVLNLNPGLTVDRVSYHLFSGKTKVFPTPRESDDHAPQGGSSEDEVYKRGPCRSGPVTLRIDQSFTRDHHLLLIEPDRPLAAGDHDTFTVTYHGVIDEEACYPDVDELIRGTVYRPGEVFTGVKRFSFNEPDYLLLTPENGWYPRPGGGYSGAHPVNQRLDFARYDLEVRTREDLTAISQGVVDTVAAGHFRFRPESPLPSVTVTVGPYELRSVTVDSVAYNLYVREGHAYFEPYFTTIGDTLPDIIRDLQQSFENRIGLEYRFPRLSLIEVPIHFFCFRHTWTINQEVVQPEMVLLPEKGLPFYAADFQQVLRHNRRHTRHSNEDVSEMESEIQLLRRFVGDTLTDDFMPTSYWWGGDDFEFDTDYNLFPNYLSFANHLVSTEWPVLNLALESYFVGRLEDRSTEYFRFTVGLVPGERVNLALKNQNLPDLMANPDRRDLLPLVLKNKGDYLFLLLESICGEERFAEFLTRQLELSRFRDLSLVDFLAALDTEFDLDFRPYIDTWYESRELPGYLAWDHEVYQVLDGDRTRYQVRFKLANAEQTDGLVRIAYRQRSEREGGASIRDADPHEAGRLMFLKAGQIKEFGQVLDFEPSSVRIVTMVSRNIPTIIFYDVPEVELRKSARPFDGESIIEGPIRYTEPGEIVVDNEDDGFAVETSPARCLLRKWFPRERDEEDSKYVGLRFWSDINSWQPTINPHFYGKYVRSSHYTNADRDNVRKASWSADITEAGFYDLYVHVYRLNLGWERSSAEFGTNQFLIDHEDGVEQVELDLDAAENGWNHLGSYYFRAGVNTVEITNETRKRFVLADAMKWVKR